jgi:hypothetical protein
VRWILHLISRPKIIRPKIPSTLKEWARYPSSFLVGIFMDISCLHIHYKISWLTLLKKKERSKRYIYLWRKVVCFVVWDPRNRDASDRVLGVFGKLSTRRGALAWFHDSWTCGVKVLEYWMIFSLKIKLNRSWKFWRNWNVALVLLERSCWAWCNGIYLIRFGFRMWEILI